MQCASASRQVLSLYQKISASALSCTTAVYLREADVTYLQPRTQIDVQFGDALRSIDFRVAIKAHLKCIPTLLGHFSPDVRTIRLCGSSTLAVIDTAAALPTARGHMGAVLRAEDMLVFWSTESCDTVASQYRDVEHRLELAALLGREYLTSPSPTISEPSSKFDGWPVYDFLPSMLDFTSSSLSSLPELASLQGFDDTIDGYTWDFVSGQVNSHRELCSLRVDFPGSPVSSLDTTPSTVCLSDISPPPPSAGDDTRNLPHDEDGSSSGDDVDLLPARRRISPFPKRCQNLPSSPTSSSATSPLDRPPTVSSPKDLVVRALSPSGGRPCTGSCRPHTTTATPLLSSLSLANSPSLGVKRKSPSPAAGELSPRQSPVVGPSPIASEHISSSQEGLCPLARVDEDMEEDESDLSDADCAGDDSDSDEDLAPPMKRSKVTRKAMTSAGPKAKGAGPKRRGGRGASQKKKKFTCDDCGAKFSREGDRKRHLESSCPNARNVKQYQCDHCPSFFNREDALKRHLRSHHPKFA